MASASAGSPVSGTSLRGREVGLADVAVRERLVYDAEQLEGIAASDLLSLCACAEGKAQLLTAARALAGKVWSAKVYARKPV